MSVSQASSPRDEDDEQIEVGERRQPDGHHDPDRELRTRDGVEGVAVEVEERPLADRAVAIHARRR